MTKRLKKPNKGVNLGSACFKATPRFVRPSKGNFLLNFVNSQVVCPFFKEATTLTSGTVAYCPASKYMTRKRRS